MIETVYLSQKAKDQLIKVKRSTGIQNWNILCRWAFCLSLKDESFISEACSTSNLIPIMEWKVFGGKNSDIYYALLKERCQKEGLPQDKEVLTKQLRAHLHRGIGQLAQKKDINNISDLLLKIT